MSMNMNNPATIDDVFETLQSFMALVSESFEKVRGDFDKVWVNFDKVNERFDGVDARLDGLDQRMDGLEGRQLTLEVGQRDLTRRVGSLEGEIKATRNDLKELYSLVQ